MNPEVLPGRAPLGLVPGQVALLYHPKGKGSKWDYLADTGSMQHMVIVLDVPSPEKVVVLLCFSRSGHGIMAIPDKKDRKAHYPINKAPHPTNTPIVTNFTLLMDDKTYVDVRREYWVDLVDMRPHYPRAGTWKEGVKPPRKPEVDRQSLELLLALRAQQKDGKFKPANRARSSDPLH
ncbi:hypothetical protein RUND412_004348 [Rhizina undulata]